MFEAVGALLEFLQRLIFCLGALYDRAYLALADIIENCLELVGSGRVLGDVQFEVGTMEFRLAARRVLDGSFGSICRGLLQYSSSSDRGRRASLVKEGDNV